jgi:hypothetical protein
MEILKEFNAYNKYKMFLDRQNYLPVNEAKKNTQDDDRDELIKAAKEDVERCVAMIMGRFKFFGEFVYKFRFLYTYRVNTMATDGANIFVNPRFCKDLNDKQIIFVLCHEILHNVMNHFVRKEQAGMTDHDRFNRAADYEINPMLVDEGLLTVSELTDGLKGLYKEKYAGMACEAIYQDLGESGPQEDPPQADDEADYYPAEIGNVVKTKSGKYGIIQGINSDGTYDVKEISKEEAEKALKP